MIFGTLTTVPQRGIVILRDCAEYEYDNGEGWWMTQDAIHPYGDDYWFVEGGSVFFRSLYARRWRWHCWIGGVAGFVLLPTKERQQPRRHIP